MSINDCVEMTTFLFLMFFYLCKNARFQRFTYEFNMVIKNGGKTIFWKKSPDDSMDTPEVKNQLLARSELYCPSAADLTGI